jgi:maltose alpha-D-glucosyltransferase/alpha-amylase
MAQDSLWYKDAVIYQAHVRAFFDSTNDGVGDFRGLTDKLEYIEGLGVDAVWLLPFYPSPLHDDGYDIADYENVYPSYGTLEDFDRFVAEAHRRGIRVITELVINHTSDQHPWFQTARRAAPGSRARDFYVWSDTNQKYQGVPIIFSDGESSNWEWDDVAGQFYWHRFFRHQPDLNFDNPDVLEAVVRVMRFWLDRGVDGMRLDAVPYLIEREGTICANLDETHAVLRHLRRELDAGHRDRMLLAEANQWPPDVRPYYGDSDECHMAFNFPLMPRMFMALQQEDRHPIVEILRQTPEIPETCQWGLFLRNHDELTLEMVTDEERDYMYQTYAADPQMRIHGGIRRRLAPLMENSRRRVELMNSLLFALPGTPVIYYGDEIGMGDNIYLGDRNAVRTPMQWTGDRNAGFSRADAARLYAPLIADPVYGFQAINVESQERVPYSLLNWMKRMIALRKQHRVFGRGTIEVLPAQNRKVFAFVRTYQDETVLCVANLSRSVQPVEIDLTRFRGMVPVEMLGQTQFLRIGDQPYFLTLGAYAFYWFRVQQAAPAVTERVARETVASAAEAPALMVGTVWETLLDGHARTLIERELLIPFLARQRWFTASTSRKPRSARFVDRAVLRRRPQPLFLTILEVDFETGPPEQFFLPLTVSASSDARGIEERSPHAILASVTGARKGLLFDAWLDDYFAQTLLEVMEKEDRIQTSRGAIRAWQARAFGPLRRALGETVPLTRPSPDQINTSIVYGDHLLLKLFRRIQPGINPDREIGRHLSENVRFTRVPAVAGAIEYDRPGESGATIGMMRQLVESQVDGWTHATDWLARFYDQVRSTVPPETPSLSTFTELANAAASKPIFDALSGYLETAAGLGKRTAELHLVLAADSSDPAFAPQPFGGDDLATASDRALADAQTMLQSLETYRASGDSRVPEEVTARVRALLAGQDTLLDSFRSVHDLRPGGKKIRIHGDFRLGQIRIAEGDFYVVNFEGDVSLPLAERREKQSPFKDLAGMLRSFSYAAHAALFAHTTTRPAGFAQLEPWARLWQMWVSAAFLRSYMAMAEGGAFLPANPGDRDALLRFFMLDRAVDELSGELTNRPEWVRIPLVGILELMQGPAPQVEAATRLTLEP